MVRDAGFAHRQDSAGNAAAVRGLHPDLRAAKRRMSQRFLSSKICETPLRNKMYFYRIMLKIKI